MTVMSSRVLPRLALLVDCALAKCVGNIEAAVAKVESLVQALGATTNDDHLLAHECIDAFGELIEMHEPALAELGRSNQRLNAETLLATPCFVN